MGETAIGRMGKGDETVLIGGVNTRLRKAYVAASWFVVD
jgi:hypothetical protein